MAGGERTDELGRYGVWRRSSLLTPELARTVERLGYGTLWLGGSPDGDLRLVEELLILARTDSATAEMPLAAVDLREVLGDLCDEMRGLAEMRQIRINRAYGDRAAIVAGNRPALHRLFLVLLDNALKFSHPGGEVILKVENSDSKVSVTIEDFGVGIRERDRPHIFERFYRADRARSGGGHGLGLSLAKSIARVHGASIDVHSTEGVGSRFRVDFAARDARPTVAADTSRAPSTKI